jgi:hypothetical protein
MLGDEVRGIDTSKDGAWVLATCESYLLLFPTSQGGKNGFDFMFKKAYKPVPKVLRVNAAAAHRHGIHPVNFLYGRFDCSRNDLETKIVASSGPWVMIWSFKDILEDNLVTNEIKRMTDDVVCNEFRFDSDQLLAATKNEIIKFGTRDASKKNHRGY